jgi:hypothetical protein
LEDEEMSLRELAMPSMEDIELVNVPARRQFHHLLGGEGVSGRGSLATSAVRGGPETLTAGEGSDTSTAGRRLAIAVTWASSDTEAITTL